MPSSAPEDCTNGIDDDGDGLIDLNDPDCVCKIIKPVSLIPNPSFEEDLLPNQPGTAGLCRHVDSSFQATTDYLNTCGWFGWFNIPVPQPLPDGEACIGFPQWTVSKQHRTKLEGIHRCLSPISVARRHFLPFALYRLLHISDFTAHFRSFYGSTDCQCLPLKCRRSRSAAR